MDAEDQGGPSTVSVRICPACILRAVVTYPKTDMFCIMSEEDHLVWLQLQWFDGLPGQFLAFLIPDIRYPLLEIGVFSRRIGISVARVGVIQWLVWRGESPRV